MPKAKAAPAGGARLPALAPAHPRLMPAGPKAGPHALVEAFLRGRRASTLKNYSLALDDFARFAGAKGRDEAAALLLSRGHGSANGMVLEYRGALKESGLSANTVNVRLYALRSLVKVARLVGMVNWSLDVEGLRVEKYRDTRGCGLEAARSAMRALAPRQDAVSRRDLALVCLLFIQGLRREEVVSLDLSSLDLKNGKLRILGKGRSGSEEVTLAPATARAVSGWLDSRGRDPGPLFFGRRASGGRLTGNGLWRVTTRLGLGRPHGLRHAGITEALDRTKGDVRSVQRFSRHRDVRVLLVYDDNRRDLGGEVAKMLGESVSEDLRGAK